MAKTNPMYKDTVFRMLFKEPKKAIPVPRFVVFYNGEEAQAEKFSYRLSDLYAKQVEDPELELIVTVYNINEGMNEDLKNACRSLKEYMQFVAQVNQNRKTMPLQEAIEKAVKDCMTQDILKEFLENNRNQVVSTTLEEFDQELYEKIIRDEGIEEGRRLERENTEKEKQRANAAEKEIERLKALLEEKE